MTDDDVHRWPPQFPPAFASAWGDDEFGLWVEFEVASESGPVKQKMRWIEPGTFWMGSPDDEPERLSIEGPLHLVTLTAGFWLADTACTQALWFAVTRTNPSHFHGEQLPVESVSWEDVEQFLHSLEARLGGHDIGLPTEAQWEYACRAGSQTPFNCGSKITTVEANYDGGAPYAGGVEGEHRQRTVTVHSLPANSWGLFEMHGNVWEWCADGLRRYTENPVVDPIGRANDARRVLRGGSWIYDAGDVRSASRRASEPVIRHVSIGFRLCSGSK